MKPVDNIFARRPDVRRDGTEWLARSSPHDDRKASLSAAIGGVLAPTPAVVVKRTPGEQFDRVVACQLGDKPLRRDSDNGPPEYAPAEDEEVSF